MDKTEEIPCMKLVSDTSKFFNLENRGRDLKKGRDKMKTKKFKTTWGGKVEFYYSAAPEGPV